MKKIGIVAIDPTSPFSGGAILGDRIRMNDLTLDEGVYIRSMASPQSWRFVQKDYRCGKTDGCFRSRCHFHRNSRRRAVRSRYRQECGYNTRCARTRTGDDIQAIKAGILEIGDVFCINKCDRDGADRLNVEIEMMLDLGEAQNWRPPIERTIANKDEGVADVVKSLNSHRKYLEESGLLEERRRERARTEMVEMIHDRISRHVMEDIVQTGKFADYVEQVYERENDPFTVVDSIVGNIFK